MISAKVIAHSKHSLFGNEIISYEVVMPRYILAEFNTHRMLSKNSASSRAIKFEKLLESVRENPFIPVAWMKDHTGMQGHEYITDEQIIKSLTNNHLYARDSAIEYAIGQSKLGLTKQLVNRLLEPFMWHKVLVTGTEWENFFAQRCPQYEYGYKLGSPEESGKEYFRSRKDLLRMRDSISRDNIIENLSDLEWRKSNRGMADIHMMDLAEAIWDAKNESTPKILQPGEWHIPYGDEATFIYLLDTSVSQKEATEKLIKVSTARCARTSYTVVGEEGKPTDYEKDLVLYDKLLKSGHWSPFEHCAKAMNRTEYISSVSEGCIGWSGNFRGFIQYRKTFANDNHEG